MGCLDGCAGRQLRFGQQEARFRCVASALALFEHARRLCDRCDCFADLAFVEHELRELEASMFRFRFVSYLFKNGDGFPVFLLSSGVVALYSKNISNAFQRFTFTFTAAKLTADVQRCAVESLCLAVIA